MWIIGYKTPWFVESGTLCVSAADLASAYKRVSNILSKSDINSVVINESLLQDEVEKTLVAHFNAIKPEIDALYANGQYDLALNKLAELKDDVDSFFEHVMVNVDDIALKTNRISILRNLSSIFSNTADISVLY